MKSEEPSKELLDLRWHRSELCTLLDTCYLLATDYHDKRTLLESRIATLKEDISKCDNEKDLNKLAYQVIYFVHEFISFRN